MQSTERQHSNVDAMTCVVIKPKKRRVKYFETYITKVLKEVAGDNPKSGITKNAKEQLNSLVCSIAHVLSTTTAMMTNIADKRTLSEKEVACAVMVYFSGDLAANCVREGWAAVTAFQSGKVGMGSRQGKAGIVFPPSLSEKFIRDSYQCLVSKNAPVFMAAVLEYVVAEILLISVGIAEVGKHSRITVRDMNLAVRQDTELDELFTKLNASFVGGGVVPYIHASLLSRDTGRPQVIRSIRRMQSVSNQLTLSKNPFERLVRHIFASIKGSECKISKDLFVILQYYIEQYVVDVFKDANMAAVHSGRVKVTNSDIEFVYSLRGSKGARVNGIHSELKPSTIVLSEISLGAMT